MYGKGLSLIYARMNGSEFSVFLYISRLSLTFKRVAVVVRPLIADNVSDKKTKNKNSFFIVFLIN
jgi:hypothetical protein